MSAENKQLFLARLPFPVAVSFIAFCCQYNKDRSASACPGSAAIKVNYHAPSQQVYPIITGYKTASHPSSLPITLTQSHKPMFSSLPRSPHI